MYIAAIDAGLSDGRRKQRKQRKKENPKVPRGKKKGINKK
jgi:hypothetical protein